MEDLHAMDLKGKWNLTREHYAHCMDGSPTQTKYGLPDINDDLFVEVEKYAKQLQALLTGQTEHD
jgi:hypothetical protein